MMYMARACMLFDGQDLSDAAKMADFLESPHTVIDLRDIYKDIVLRYFVDSYQKGITPNPCVLCRFQGEVWCVF